MGRGLTRSRTHTSATKAISSRACRTVGAVLPRRGARRAAGLTRLHRLPPPTGRGVLTFGDGGSYDGEFVDGGVLQAPPPLAAQNDRPRREPEIEGQGVRRWASGATYVGSFHCGEFDGNGTLTSPSGYRYEGQWKLNQHHGSWNRRLGPLAFRRPSHLVLSCALKALTQFELRGAGRGVWERADGTVFEGGFHHHEPHGRCVERGPDGEVRDGEWRHGRLHGHALWRGADGSWYEGEWENGLRHGHGRGYDAVSGVEYLGPFRDDAPVGTWVGSGTAAGRPSGALRRSPSVTPPPLDRPRCAEAGRRPAGRGPQYRRRGEGGRERGERGERAGGQWSRCCCWRGRWAGARRGLALSHSADRA